MGAPKIAIIGAGPAGCMLARLLLEQNRDAIDITIFEGEPSLNVRSQGGTLDLHRDSGLAAVRQAGLYEQFLREARYDGEAFLICDKATRPYLHFSGSTKPHDQTAKKKHGSSAGGDRPEIDRSALRKILLDSLPAEIIHWNKRLTGVRRSAESNDASWELHFTNGTNATGFDLIVGADGAWSKVRSTALSPETAPSYTGIGGFQLVIPDAAATAADQYRLVDRGSCFAYDGGDKPHRGRSIMGQQMGDGSIDVSVWMVRPEDWMKTAEYDINNAAEVKKRLIEKDFTDWDSRILGLIQKADDCHVVSRSLYMLPVGFSWEHQKGITILGDAAHLMSPFAGLGVNLAFEDAMRLADAITKTAKVSKSGATTEARVALDKNVLEFERDMCQRATRAQQLTFNAMTLFFFRPGAPGSAIEQIVLQRMQFMCTGWQTPLFRLLYPFLWATVYAGYGIYKAFGLRR